MRELVMPVCVWVMIILVYKGCNKGRVDNTNQYLEISKSQCKIIGYLDVQLLLSEEFIHEETDLAQRIWLGIDSLHKIERNKIDSLNKVLENGN